MIKNIKVIIIALIIASPCWGQAGTIQNQIILHTQTDSLNYAMGFANGNAIKNYFFKDKPLDESIHVFLKYFDEGFTSDKQFVKPDSTTNKYAEIIETLATDYTLLPVRFGSTMESSDQLLQMLERNYTEIQQNLKKLKDK